MEGNLMNKYQDKWGRFHHKECINGEPSSGNGWIYTAYYDKLSNGMVMGNLRDCFNLCYFYDFVNGLKYLNRSPGKSNPPISRDEILGMVSLGLLKPEDLEAQKNRPNWNFSPYPLPKFSTIKLVFQLWELRPKYYIGSSHPSGNLINIEWKHRNYFWQQNLDQIYRFAFSVPLTDRAFILKCWGETKTPRALFYRAIAFLDSKIGADSGIRWLKYGKSKEAMLKEFGEDHPFRSV